MTDAGAEEISAIILAAGESSRMGEQKALLDWRGAPLLAYQLRELARVPQVRDIIVVTGHHPVPVERIAREHHARVARNDAYGSGKVSSILAGLRALGDNTHAIMILAVDQPRAAAALRAVVDAHVRAAAPITVPTHDGRRGHPPVFSRALLPELLRIDEGTLGLRAVMEGHAAEIHEVECDASVLVDLNEPSDVAEASAEAPAE